MNASDTGLRHAFKEWAVVCEALAQGRQSLILRKGGILEIDSGFRVEHERFWLYPTYVHQQAAGVTAAARELFEEARRKRPPEGRVCLGHFAEVVEVHHIETLEAALALGGLHVWSEETVRARFAYRRPGLFALVVRVYRAPEAIELPVTPYYEGCKSWVELERPLPTAGARPVLAEGEYQARVNGLRACFARPGDSR